MNPNSIFLRARLRDLGQEFTMLCDAIVYLETMPDTNVNEGTVLALQKLKVQLCQKLLELEDIFGCVVSEWDAELKKESEV